MPECMPDKTPEYMPDKMQDGMSEHMPDRMSEYMPDRMSEYMPDKMPEYMPEYGTPTEGSVCSTHQGFECGGRTSLRTSLWSLSASLHRDFQEGNQQKCCSACG